MYEIIKVNRHYMGGACVTREKTIAFVKTIDRVLEIAERKGADLDEVREELTTYGVTCFRGYMVSEMTERRA